MRKLLMLSTATGGLLLIMASWSLLFISVTQKSSLVVRPFPEKVGPEPVRKISSAYDGNTPWVFIFSYIRGGSSFLGSIFDHNPEAFYLYEPLSDVYNAMLAAPLMTFPSHVVNNPDGTPRNITQLERTFIQMYTAKSLSCHFDDIPLEMLYSWTLSESTKSRSYTTCLKETAKYYYHKQPMLPFLECKKKISSYCTTYPEVALAKGCNHYTNLTRITLDTDAAYREMKLMGITFKTDDYNSELVPSPSQYIKCLKIYQREIQRCVGLWSSVCRKASFKATKIVRATMESIEDFIKVHPNIYVIHQLRDPRGTIYSRYKGHRLFYDFVRNKTKGRSRIDELVLEAKLLCRKISKDIEARKKLEMKYPGVFLEVKYEELADEPLKALKIIYDHVGLSIPSEIYDWVIESTAAKKDNGKFAEKRANSSRTAHAWQEKMKPEIREKVDQVCAEIYKHAGYN